MRAAIVAVVAVVGLIAFPTPGGTAPLALPDAVAVSSPDVVPVAGGCGRGYHPVGGYRNQWGRWVPRRCVPNW